MYYSLFRAARSRSRAVHFFALTGLLALLITAGCGGGGGSSGTEDPVSAALVVGPSKEQVSVTVRAGSELLLNGENSDGTRFPIQSATWVQTDGTGISVQLDKRTELTRAVRVPMVDVETNLTFELTIVNTDGDRSITEVSVRVLPISDTDQFLEYFRAIPEIYTVVAALNAGTTATSDVTFTVSHRPLVNYADRTSTTNTPNAFDLQIEFPRRILDTGNYEQQNKIIWRNSAEADIVVDHLFEIFFRASTFLELSKCGGK